MGQELRYSLVGCPFIKFFERATVKKPQGCSFTQRLFWGGIHFPAYSWGSIQFLMRCWTKDLLCFSLNVDSRLPLFIK